MKMSLVSALVAAIGMLLPATAFAQSRGASMTAAGASPEARGRAATSTSVYDKSGRFDGNHEL